MPLQRRSKTAKAVEPALGKVCTFAVDEAGLADGDVTALVAGVDIDSPERALVATVLLEAVLDFRRGDVDALAWVESHEEIGADDLFTFVGACRELDLEPEAVRRAVAAQPPLPPLWDTITAEGRKPRPPRRRGAQRALEASAAA